MVLIGVAMIVRTLAARRRAARARRSLLGVLFVAAGAGRLWRRRAATPSARTPPARLSAEALRRGLGLAGAVRDRLHVVASVDLLLARRRRRSARSGSRRSSSSSPACSSRCSCADLRRGRLAAPGARRRDRLRPLRLQRAGQLRRRLGDPARLPDPDRGHARSRRRTTWPRSGAPLGHGAPEFAARAARSSPTSRCATSAASPRRASTASRRWSSPTSRCSCADRRARARRCSSTPTR